MTLLLVVLGIWLAIGIVLAFFIGQVCALNDPNDLDD